MAEVASRGNRAEETRRERRKKPGSTVAAGLKLHIPEDQLDRKKFAYRWVNDTPGRVQRMHDEDWDPAPVNDASTETRFVGTDGGKPTNAVLMQKPKDWYDADQKEKNKGAEELDRQITRGTAHKNNGLSGDEFYTPDAGNSVKTPGGVDFRD